MFSTARIGCPAATVPTSGTLTTSRRTRLKLSSIISIARGLVASLRIYPFFRELPGESEQKRWTSDLLLHRSHVQKAENLC